MEKMGSPSVSVDVADGCFPSSSPTAADSAHSSAAADSVDGGDALAGGILCYD